MSLLEAVAFFHAGLEETQSSPPRRSSPRRRQEKLFNRPVKQPKPKKVPNKKRAKEKVLERGPVEQLHTEISDLENYVPSGPPSIFDDASPMEVGRRVSYLELHQEILGPEKRKRAFSPWNPYVYSVLPPGHIRLLQFKSNLIYSPWSVSFDLIDVPLDNLPSYEALSYRWSKGAKDKVYCDGGTLQVSTNCKAALKSLNKEGRLLWVDAVCINQQNGIEKNHQVALMSQIYSHAKGTIAWLGKDADLGASCLEDIEEANRHFDNIKDTSTGSGIDDNTIVTSLAFSKLLLRDWFSRIWILQEVALAKEIWVSCGSQTTKWTAFMGVLKRLKIRGGLPPECRAAWNLETFRKDYRRNGPQRGVDIHAAMVQSRQCDASDPRDKVYALLGVCPELANVMGEPDYNLPVTVVWARAQRACFSGQLSINALSLVSVGDRIEKDVPSWVPDLSTGLKTWPRRPPPPATSDGIASILQCSFGDPSCLHVRGTFVDTLVSPFEYNGNRTLDETVVQWRKWWTRFIELDMSRAGSNADNIHAFWSTLYCDNKWSVPNTETLSAWHKRVIPFSSFPQTLDSNTVAFHDVKASELAESTIERVFGLTHQGTVGLFPKNAEVGDRVVLFRGGSTPYLVRPTYHNPAHTIKREEFVLGELGRLESGLNWLGRAMFIVSRRAERERALLKKVKRL